MAHRLGPLLLAPVKVPLSPRSNNAASCTTAQSLYNWARLRCRKTSNAAGEGIGLTDPHPAHSGTHVPTDGNSIPPQRANAAAFVKQPAVTADLRGLTHDEEWSFDAWLRSNPLPGHKAQLQSPTQPTRANAGDGPRGSSGPGGATRQRQQQRGGKEGRGKQGGTGDTSGKRQGRGSDEGEPAVVRCRDFLVADLAAVLAPLTHYPRVEWDARRLAWVAYRCAACSCGVAAAAGGAGGGNGLQRGSQEPTRTSSTASSGGSFSPPACAADSGHAASFTCPVPERRRDLLPAVRVVLPRIAPRPGGARGRRAVASGEGWDCDDGWGAGGLPNGGSGSGGGGMGFGRTLAAYLDELRCSAEQPVKTWKHPGLTYAAQWDLRGGVATGSSNPAGSLACSDVPGQPPTSSCAADGAGASELDSWGELEVAADEEEAQLLAEADAEAQRDYGTGASPAAPSPLAAQAPSLPRVLPVPWAAVLLSADSAALGVWAGGRLVRHKVLTGYTVRHSAGGSQARHERRGGGGHSVGAALRRAEAARLWQAVAARLAAWEAELAGCELLVRSGDSRVWAALYEARRPPPPLGPRDGRWERAGMGVPRPRLRDLLALQRRMATGRVEELAADAGGRGVYSGGNNA